MVGVHKHQRFLVISSDLVQSGIRLNVVNLYAPNDAVLRRGVWSDLLQIRNSLPGLWIVMGDFNEVRDSSERYNSVFVASSVDVFNNFILAADFHEYNMGGGRFTFMSDKGDKLSKLDRVLVYGEFKNRWPIASLLALERDCSDHRPLLLSTVQSDYGHIPFRFYNSWLEIPGFTDYVFTLCGGFKFPDAVDLALATKLRWLKIV
ncbi:uncharacterized protein LOC110943591 [Helianthus annuus]|uniref:uncharacterized protein LOC110943591 n=1 Tax=Helianthus annuus TaxID=4232 RepID=UPI000B8F4574|nr:uncharacterized protein LOC110943591 [Helianthus annuus]